MVRSLGSSNLPWLAKLDTVRGFPTFHGYWHPELFLGGSCPISPALSAHSEVLPSSVERVKAGDLRDVRLKHISDSSFSQEGFLAGCDCDQEVHPTRQSPYGAI
jgi:hypothetical protein